MGSPPASVCGLGNRYWTTRLWVHLRAPVLVWDTCHHSSLITHHLSFNHWFAQFSLSNVPEGDKKDHHFLAIIIKLVVGSIVCTINR